MVDLDFEPGAGVNIICGQNAQGKTNLLEALWLFCGGRNFRGSKDTDYIAFDGDHFALELDFFAGKRNQSAAIHQGPDGKQILINEIRAEKVSSLSEIFRAVVFSPDHLELVKQGPKERRKLIDFSLCQAYPKYGKILESYERILRQRAVLLGDASKHAQVMDMMDIWDEGLTQYGGYITWMRAKYVGKLAEYAAAVYEGISGGQEKFSAYYAAGCGKIPLDGSRKDITEILAKAVKANRKNDIRLGRTVVGPHRDDIEIMINGQSARAFASQGQQRSCVLALKLAECRILQEGAGEAPIVLLDDVMSELDESRREYLLNSLKDKQVVITCCDTSAFGALREGKVFRMRAGVVTVDS